MAGFRRVLCATDLSEAADRAVQQADREARWHGAELALLHVIPMTYPGAPMTPEEVEHTMVEEERLASQIIDVLLERVERLTGRDAGQVSVLVEDGAPAETIIAQADQLGADLLVVGSHGTGGARRLLFGRVAEYVAKHAHASVLIARPDHESGRIVVATDFSGPDEPATRLAAEEAVRRCAALTMVHSIEVLSPEVALGEPGAMPPLAFGAYPIAELREIARKRLTQTMARLGVTGDIEVTEGPPADAIVKVAADEQADLLVVGTSGRTGIDRLLLGSVASGVIRRAPCSVLVARPPGHPKWQTATSSQASV
jgi:nucleotide-binding universal stress UspA family protein